MFMDVGIFQRDIVDMGRISILRAFFRGEAAAEGVCWLSRCILVNPSPNGSIGFALPQHPCHRAPRIFWVN